MLANGSVVRADVDTNPDLYWALRGCGGGNFGVATWTDAGMAVADRHGNGENYQNTVDSRLTDWRSAYYKENYPRLVG